MLIVLGSHRYSNIDYALASTLEQFIGMDFPIEIDYNIACKYRMNILTRFENQFPDVAPLLDHMTFYLPEMHIKAHQEKCQRQFKREFFPYTGKCDGEGSERMWSELNQWASSISEMNLEHHHDILDDNLNDWNMRKVLGMGT